MSDNGSGDECEEDFEYAYEEDNDSDIYGNPMSEPAPRVAWGFLDGTDADLCTWSRGNPLRLAVCSCLRQIAMHESHNLSVVFSAAELMKEIKVDETDEKLKKKKARVAPEIDIYNSPELKEFIVMIALSDKASAMYAIQFSAVKEMALAPPLLRCLSDGGRRTYLFPDLLFPDRFGPFIDYGKLFCRLRDEWLSHCGQEEGLSDVSVGSLGEGSVGFAIQKMAYLTQYHTSFVVSISEGGHGIITGKSREQLTATGDSGTGYTRHDEVISRLEACNTYYKTLIGLIRQMETVEGRELELMLRSPLVEILHHCIRELSPEEVLHAPEFGEAIFNLLAVLQTHLKAAAVSSPQLTGHKRERSDDSKTAVCVRSDLSDDTLLLLLEFKTVLGDIHGLDRIVIPRRLTHADVAAAGSGALKSPGDTAISGGDESTDEMGRRVQTGSVVVSEEHFKRYTFVASGTPPVSLMRRCRVELNTLRNNLMPNIHVLATNEDFRCYKFLVVGPEGTPYENGCFLFDLMLPSDYPANPPQVTIQTTGGGTVRFNPNLYKCGKVCLSLLGTWSGEPWNPVLSNINQVLMSICFMIFVAEPYYNEPGYASHRPSTGSDITNSPSYIYNGNIRKHTLQTAVLGHLQRPDPDFGPLIEAIIRHRWSKSVVLYQRWVEEHNPHQADVMRHLITQIEGRLEQQPSGPLPAVASSPSGAASDAAGMDEMADIDLQD